MLHVMEKHFVLFNFFFLFNNHKLHILALIFFLGILKNARQKHDSSLIDVVTV